MKKIASAIVALGLFLGASLGTPQLRLEAGAGDGGGAVGGIPIEQLIAGAGEGGGCV